MPADAAFGAATSQPGAVRIAVVLSAGGLRGVAHLGVLRQLVAHRIPIDVMVGVSAGAIIAGFYAGVGLSIDDLINDAPEFKGRHLLWHSLAIRSPRFAVPTLRRFCGVIPTRLEQLESARFDHLHHGVSGLGVVCHDQRSNAPFYFSTLEHRDAPWGRVIRSSAALPNLFPASPLVYRGHQLALVDGGVSDSLPFAFARERLGATHLIVSDCRRLPAPAPPSPDPTVVYVRPDLDGAQLLRSPAGTLLESVAKGEAACTPDAIARVRAWSAPAESALVATRVLS